MESIDGYAAGEDDLLDSCVSRGNANLRRAFHIGLVIAGERAHIVAVFCGKIHYGAGAASHIAERFLPPHVALHTEIRIGFTSPEVANPHRDVLLGQ
jgi:hypothetical protein